MNVNFGNLGFEFDNKATISLFYKEKLVSKLFPLVEPPDQFPLDSPVKTSFQGPVALSSSLGEGLRYTVEMSFEHNLVCLSYIEYYPHWQDNVFLRWRFENRGNVPVEIHRLSLPRLIIPRPTPKGYGHSRGSRSMGSGFRV